jgi:dolichol-phosphate mannosyltransferase
MDCDFTHSPSDIPRMLAASKDGDIVVGSRYLQDNSLPGWNPFRRFLTYFAHFLTRVCLGNKFDASGAFRVYDLQKIPVGLFQIIRSNSYSFFFESLFILTKNNFSINEIPIVLPSRTYGHSKMSVSEAFKSVRYLMFLTWENSLNPGRFRMGRVPKDSVNK